MTKPCIRNTFICFSILSEILFLLSYSLSCNISVAKSLEDQRLHAYSAIKMALKGNCNTFNSEIELIDSPSIRDAAIWYAATTAKKCATLDSVIDIFYYRKELGELNKQMMNSFTSYLLKQSIIANNHTKERLFLVLEDILDSSISMEPEAKVASLSAMKSLNVKPIILKQYVNKIWAEESFTKQQWDAFFESYAHLLEEESHISNIQNILISGDKKSAINAMKYLRDITQIENISNALKIFNTSSSKQVEYILKQNKDNWLAHITALEFCKFLTDGEKLSIIKRLAEMSTPLPSSFYKYAIKTARENISENKSASVWIYKLISNINGLTGNEYFEQQIFAGWMALEINQNNSTAGEHFIYALKNAKLPTQKAKVYYWLGRTFAQKGMPEKAIKYYTMAAKNPFVFYGQLGAEEISKIPSEMAYNQLKFTSDSSKKCSLFPTDIFIELAYLFNKTSSQWVALQYLESGLNIAALRGVDSCYLKNMVLSVEKKFNYYFGKKAASMNIPIYDISFPFINSSKDSLVNAIVRQETLYISGAESHKGAVGPMQLMEKSAKEVTDKLNIKFNIERAKHDEKYNVAIGSLFIKELIGKYKNTPIALAAYNAGSGRVSKWMQKLGNPGLDKYKIINWIESIPYKETREYIISVLEAKTVYDGLNAYANTSDNS